MSANIQFPKGEQGKLNSLSVLSENVIRRMTHCLTHLFVHTILICNILYCVHLELLLSITNMKNDWI